MIRTIEAVIDEQGRVRLLENVQSPSPRRALLIILEEEPSEVPGTRDGVWKLMGKYADVPGTSEEFLAEKHKDAELGY